MSPFKFKLIRGLKILQRNFASQNLLSVMAKVFPCCYCNENATCFRVTILASLRIQFQLCVFALWHGLRNRKRLSFK